MIARDLDDTPPVAEIKWTRAGLRSFEELLHFLSAQEYADPVARAREIRSAIGALAYSPCGYPAVFLRRGAGFRRLVVLRRYLVYYVYVPSCASGEPGCVSIRAVQHGRRRRPFVTTGSWAPARFGPRHGVGMALLAFTELVESPSGADG